MEKLNSLKEDRIKLKRMKKLIEGLLVDNKLEISDVKMDLKFADISAELLKNKHKLVGLTKNKIGGYTIDYKLIDKDKIYTTSYNNYHYYGCRPENKKEKKEEDNIYNKLTELYPEAIKREYSFPDCKLTRPLYFDFLLTIGDDKILIECDESYRHYNNSDIQVQRDLCKNDYVINNKLKLLRIDPVDVDITKELLQESINKLLTSSILSILRIGKRYDN